MRATLATKGPESASGRHDPAPVPETPPGVLRATQQGLPVFLQGTPDLSHPGDPDERTAERLAQTVLRTDPRGATPSHQPRATSSEASSAAGTDAPLAAPLRSRI